MKTNQEWQPCSTLFTFYTQTRVETSCYCLSGQICHSCSDARIFSKTVPFITSHLSLVVPLIFKSITEQHLHASAICLRVFRQMKRERSGLTVYWVPDLTAKSWIWYVTLSIRSQWAFLAIPRISQSFPPIVSIPSSFFKPPKWESVPSLLDG